jgi:DNA processing protein
MAEGLGMRSRHAQLRDLQRPCPWRRHGRPSRRSFEQRKNCWVFGTGVDVVYPKGNSRLADQILSLGGALISEFPLSTFAAPQNFPIRNRIISGISFGVLVVEAAEYSGTRTTARCALEQSRDVFTVPGNVTNKNSWGPNTLIKQGAKLVATWEDVWEELPADV